MTTEPETRPPEDGLAAQFDAWLALTGQAPTAGRGAVTLPMLSGSMHPSLPRGCTLRIEPAVAGDGAATVRTGDVVVLARDGRLVAHRLLARARWRGRDYVLEMGDANRRGEWRPAREVVGRIAGAATAEGAPLACPTSRTRALKGLLRHLRGLLSGQPPSPNGKPSHDE